MLSSMHPDLELRDVAGKALNKPHTFLVARFKTRKFGQAEPTDLVLYYM